MERLRAHLHKTVGLTAGEWDLVCEQVRMVSLRKEEFFIEEGRPCKRSGFLLSGVMRYFSFDREGEDPTCYFSYETHYITDPFTFKQQTPATLNLQAITPCEVAVVSFDADRALRKALPRWGQITDQLLLAVSLDFGDQKKLLAMKAAERYEYFTRQYPALARRVPLRYVATYLGITQPSLSRLRKNLVTKK